ncbi:tRNA lysidine(34) synthetase TilS [Tepidiforma flava]|uniref:tRNA lysidine(34) synthetase TilS n=1 Tax=Tepidiforma flava TaxID=3004094 RepID=A0ABY7MAM8_9CHLR|nr:tRNA lysidine(34) synthetase TilS [Tepidiforma flava]WBL37582.1 tRNA lysidine(34) synthetase TilS [Tepidiforma flava]
MLRRGSGSVAFGDTAVDVSAGRVRIGPRLEPVEPLPPVLPDVPGSRRFGPWRVDVLTSPAEPAPQSPVAGLAAASLRGALRARHLQPGDRIAWRGVTRKVSDLLIDQKVPAWERPGAVAITDAGGPAAIFTASGVFVRDAGEPPDLWVRLAPLPADLRRREQRHHLIEQPRGLRRQVVVVLSDGPHHELRHPGCDELAEALRDLLRAAHRDERGGVADARQARQAGQLPLHRRLIDAPEPVREAGPVVVFIDRSPRLCRGPFDRRHDGRHLRRRLQARQPARPQPRRPPDGGL